MRSSPKGRLLAAGTYDVANHPRVRVVLDGMRSRGWEVDEVVEPLGLTTADRVDILRRASRLPRLVVKILRSWWLLIPRLRRSVRAHRPDAVLVGYLGNFDVALVRALVRPAPVVLDFLVAGASTAVDRGERGAVKQRALRMLDEWALRHADVIMTDTDEQARALPARHASRAVVVAVGADARWFAAGRNRAPIGSGRMSVVFYGLFTPLQGVAVIAAALRELDGLIDATLIGSGQDDPIAAPLLAGVPGVVRIPWVRADELPSVVAEHDVCLGIFGSTAKAGRVVPNKVYQGAAAGCAIVTSDTPPQRRLLGDAALLVPPGDPGALAATLRRLASDPALRVAQAAAARALAEDRFSAEQVVEPLVAALGRVL